MVSGHTRPMTSLVARLAQIRPLTVTYFIPKALYHRVETELSRNFDVDQEHLKSRIRFVKNFTNLGNPIDQTAQDRRPTMRRRESA